MNPAETDDLRAWLARQPNTFKPKYDRNETGETMKFGANDRLILINVKQIPGDEAILFLYELLREVEPSEAISHVEMPTMEEHREFCRKPPYRVWYLIAEGTTYVGYVSLTWRNEIGVRIAKEHRRKGAAAWAVKRIMASWNKSIKGKPGQVYPGFVANINPANEASIALFAKLGFIGPKQVTYVCDVKIRDRT